MPRIFFLGTAGAGGMPGRAMNCILIETSKERIVLDFGEGCGQRLEQHGYTLCDFNLVYISHLHMDHYNGLFDAVVRSSIRGCNKLVLAAAGGVYRGLNNIVELLPRSIRSNVVFIKIPLDGLRIGSFFLKPIPVNHSIETYGLYIEVSGKRIVYSADTMPTRGIINLLNNVDLLIHEVTLPSNKSDLSPILGHTSVSQALKLKEMMNQDSILAIVHTTTESMKELREISLPRGVLVPYDHTILGI